MNDAKFVNWLRQQAKAADDAAHDPHSSVDQRNLAWGRAEAYYAVLNRIDAGD